MTKPSRRALILALAAMILVAGISIAFVRTFREDNGVILKGSVILGDTYLLSTCQLPSGKYCIWSYDFRSGDFRVHTSREHLPQLLVGSTVSCIVWGENSENAQYMRSVRWFTLTAGDDSPKPLKLDGVKAYLEEIDESGFDLLQAEGEPNKFFVALVAADETNPLPFAMFDTRTGEEIGRAPDTREFGAAVCFIGPNHEYFALSDVDASNDSRIRLFDAKTFTEIACMSDNLGSYGPTLIPVADNEFVAQVSSFHFVLCRVTGDGAHPAIVVDKEIRYPEQPWKTSAIVGLKNTTETVLSGGIPTRWYNKYRDVRRSYYRKGIIAWESVRPPLLRIARVDDPNTVTDYPLEHPGEHDWPFQFSSDGTLVVTRSATDSFQVLRVALPTISVEQECRLKYDETTGMLTLERLKLK